MRTLASSCSSTMGAGSGVLLRVPQRLRLLSRDEKQRGALAQRGYHRSWKDHNARVVPGRLFSLVRGDQTETRCEELSIEC
jgi:hypothetical protein